MESLHGLFLNQYLWWIVVGAILVCIVLGYIGAPLLLWSITLVVILYGFGTPLWLLAVCAVILIVLNISGLRKHLILSPVMGLLRKSQFMPKISQTERAALEAGSTWIETDFFSGQLNFRKILNEPYAQVTPDEQAFLDGPVEELCSALDEWEVLKTKNLPDRFWEIIRKEKFFGMTIPKEYGGLAFSASGHSQVIQKIASRSYSAAVVVMVPNSLGPAELLIHYGTEEQKKYYLPRLANAEEIPCFALTEPTAGSDAGSIRSQGILFKGEDGKLYIRLNWNKRYITLAAVATLLGLAFKLKDPENLLGKGENVGITCALVPAKTEGVSIGQRHDPLGIPFFNGPTQGKDVVVPAEQIIGGIDNAGQGWKMLMESLATGRGISLPALVSGSSVLTARTVSAYAAIRRQFGLQIGKFEGTVEPMARIAGFTYILESMRQFTLGGIDAGAKPPVVTAMVKYHATELNRKIVNDGMDVLGGAAISMGPRNLLAEPYISVPIGITVEGANILTRALIIFGQGAVRAHPFAYKELLALENCDVNGFDQALCSHVRQVVRNVFRTVILNMTRGRSASSPIKGPVGIYCKRLSWASAIFAVMTDLVLLCFGGKLKFKETISGRFADVLSWLYISTAVIRRYEADGKREEDLPFAQFALRYGLGEIQKSFEDIFENLNIRGLTGLFRYVLKFCIRLNPVGKCQLPDDLKHHIAKRIQMPGEQRDRLTKGVYIPRNPEEALARLEHAFEMVIKAAPVEQKIKKAIRTKQLPKKPVSEILDLAKSLNVINEQEFDLVKNSEALRFEAIQVDDFSEKEYRSRDIVSSQTTGIFKFGQS